MYKVIERLPEQFVLCVVMIGQIKQDGAINADNYGVDMAYLDDRDIWRLNANCENDGQSVNRVYGDDELPIAWSYSSIQPSINLRDVKAINDIDANRAMYNELYTKLIANAKQRKRPARTRPSDK